MYMYLYIYNMYNGVSSDFFNVAMGILFRGSASEGSCRTPLPSPENHKPETLKPPKTLNL